MMSRITSPPSPLPPWPPLLYLPTQGNLYPGYTSSPKEKANLIRYTKRFNTIMYHIRRRRGDKSAAICSSARFSN